MSSVNRLLTWRSVIVLFLTSLAASQVQAQATAGQAPSRATPATAPAPPVAQAPAASSAGKPITFGPGVRASDPQATTPMFSPLAGGLFARQIVQSASKDGDYTVQVWTLLVSPGVTTEEARLAGAAALQVIAGQVEMISDGKRVRLEAGSTASVSDGAVVSFTNTNSSQPAQLRAVVVTSRR